MQVSDLVDKHKNQLCVIYGAGPSLHFINTEPLKEYVSIAVNSGVVKAPWCDYFLSDDIGVSTWSYYTELLPKLSCIKLLYEEKLKDHVNHLDNVVLFKHTWWFSPKDKKYNPDGLILTKKEPIIGAISSMGSAVHFAYLMGCDPIVLLGADCCYKDGYRYFWDYDGEEKPHRTKPSNVKINDKYYENFYENRVVDYWKNLAKLNPDANIIDCSDGKLTCFTKISIDKVIDKYREKEMIDGQK